LFGYGRPIELDSTKVVAAARTADPGVTREDFQALQQKTATELEAIEADLQKLSDQVSALAAKVDALQDAAAASPQPNARAQAPTKKSSKPTAN
jgi:cell division protein FtsB